MRVDSQPRIRSPTAKAPSGAFAFPPVILIPPFAPLVFSDTMRRGKQIFSRHKSDGKPSFYYRA
jgi:hypothetical protein